MCIQGPQSGGRGTTSGLNAKSMGCSAAYSDEYKFHTGTGPLSAPLSKGRTACQNACSIAMCVERFRKLGVCPFKGSSGDGKAMVRPSGCRQLENAGTPRAAAKKYAGRPRSE